MDRKDVLPETSCEVNLETTERIKLVSRKSLSTVFRGYAGRAITQYNRQKLIVKKFDNFEFKKI